MKPFRKIRKAIRRWLGRTPPPAVLASLYIGLIIFGGFAFQFPIMTTAPISLSEAFFTSTSAVTVTGLSVFDTGQILSFWGELLLAVLMQLGGLGLMTFAVLILQALGIELGVTHHVYLREDLNQTSYTRLKPLLKTIFSVVLLAETIGAFLLCLTFIPQYGFWPGLWHAIFHSVSAFNNAGFSTFSTGLIEYAADPVINSVIPLLFIIGGIGYVVISDVIRRRFWFGWTLHTRLMIVGTLALIAVGVILTGLLEWNNPKTLAQHDSITTKLTMAWFQGVVMRSAGFSTTDIAGLHDSTSLLYIALMLIGGGSTSTAGGIKVTTFVVMLLATYAFFRRHKEIHIFGRSIGYDEILKVMALVAITAVIVFTAVFLMMIAQDGHFMDISFEVAAGISNAGMSRNFTGELNDMGQIVIMFLMFLGRVGPLTLGFFLVTRATPRVRYPEGQVHLG